MKSLAPNLIVFSVNDTIEYYREYFGFELIQTVPDKGEFDWAMMQSVDVTLMFQKKDLSTDIPDLNETEPGGSFTLFIQVNNITDLYNKVKENIDVIVDLNKTFYGMNEFTIRDLNGYYLTFAEPA
ncbi:VOC family protein [Bacteroidota bacterium]